ncbi:MAG TPA: hypothetical protein VNN20_01995 [Thermodesulfobacteriota bacterium]|nr:hypothetical protein [Thermodesulfobacteriota bacterium]
MRKWLILIPLFIFILSCNDDGGGTINICFSEMSSNPCFDLNVGGSTTTVTDQTVDEVISEQESRDDFVGELEITNIVMDRAFVGIPPDSLSDKCIEAWGVNQIVIKTEEDWDRFRDSCFFSVYSSETGTPLPDIDFSTQMVMVSMQDIDALGTEIEAVLEFDSELAVIVRDDESDPPPPAPGFPFHIVSVPRIDQPVDFIRVQNLIVP